MGFTEENFPADREVFWRTIDDKIIFPGHGVSPNEWWPTAEEAELVYSIVLGEELAHNRKQKFTQEEYTALYAEGFDGMLYNWLTDNLLKENYTNDYAKQVTKEMIFRAIAEHDTVVTNNLNN